MRALLYGASGQQADSWLSQGEGETPGGLSMHRELGLRAACVPAQQSQGSFGTDGLELQVKETRRKTYPLLGVFLVQVGFGNSATQGDPPVVGLAAKRIFQAGAMSPEGSSGHAAYNYADMRSTGSTRNAP